MAPSAEKILRFGAFRLDPNRASLASPQGDVPLRPKSFDVLCYLVRHHGRIVSKDELMSAVWPKVFVTENSLVQCISEIRAALGDEGSTVLKTVPRRGYIVTVPLSDDDPAVPELRGPATAGPQPALPTRGRQGRTLLLAGLLGLMLLLAGATTWWWSARDGGGIEANRAHKRLSVAVLPLASLDAAGDEYFADGLTEDIIAALARFPDLNVLAPATVAVYRGRTPARQEIVRDLRVRYLVEGSVRRRNDRLRISMRLADARDGALIWAEQYDTAADQVMAVQDDITRAISGALAVRMTNFEQARLAARPPSSMEAYDHVLRGRDLLSRLTRTATSNARAAFENAVALDPGYAPAYVGLARVDLVAVNIGWTADPAGALRRAEAAAKRAIGLDEFNPTAHAVLGRIHARLGEYDRAVEQLRRALALNPSDPEIHAALGDALLWSGETEEACQRLEIAVRLDPKLPTQDLFNLGATYFLLGRYTEAAQVYERALARREGNAFIHAMLAAISAESGRSEEAGRQVAEVRRENPMFDLDTFGTLFRNPTHRDKIVNALQKAGM
jgi:TolB-like protein/DNA-binding winged helix-turn-helix (wHTH) protein/Tfp pilus assembly protein PilF